MKKIFLFSAFLFSFAMDAQTVPVIEWEKSFGGSSIDHAQSIQQTTDGGYIVAGFSHSNDGDLTGNYGKADFWIIKLGSNGTIQWQKHLGGSEQDYALFIQQTLDGGYIVVGESQSNDVDVTGNHGNFDYWIVKLDSSGNIQWQKSLGGSDYDRATSVQQTVDGGYIVAGQSNSYNGDVTGNHGASDYWIVKLDSNGTIQWQKSLGGSDADYATSVQQTVDGGYIVAGYSFSNNGDVTGNHGASDYWIVKLDSNGTIQWQKSIGGSDFEQVRPIRQTSDGGYIVAGYSHSNDGDVTGNHGGFDYWIVKLDNNGSIEWQKSLGGSGFEFAYSIQQSTDGGYIVAGSSNSNDGDVTGNYGGNDYWIVKLDSNGNIEWEKSLGGSNDDTSYSVLQSTDGNYIIAGNTQSNDGDISENQGIADFWVVKLSADGMATQEFQNGKIVIYPNPVTDVLHFSEEISNIRIMDISGRTIKEFSASGKSVEVSAIGKGVYVISGTSKSGKKISGKFIKE